MQFHPIGVFGLILLFLSHITSNNLAASPLQNPSRVKRQPTSAVFVEYGDKSISHYIIKPQFLFSIDRDQYVSLFRYNIGIEYIDILKYPYKVTRILFINKELLFEDSAILPEPLIFTFDVYTCKHNNPVLLKIYSQSGYNFYFPNPESGKWTNYPVESLKEFGNVDRIGLISYRSETMKKYDLMHELIHNEATRMAERLCKKDECVDNSSGKNFPLEISIKAIKNREELVNVHY